MRTKLRSKVTLLFMVLGLVLAVPAVALADQLRDTLDTAASVVTITEDDATGFTNQYYIFAQGPEGCDVSSTTPAVFEIVTPTGVTASTNQLTFTQCSTQNSPPNNTQGVKFTSDTANPDGYSISARQISGPTMNVTNAAFTLKVNAAPVTNTAPTLSLPGNQTVEATGAGGAAVTYTATANDTEDGALTPQCTPASGSTFPLGTTTVSCAATDAAGNTANGSFTVNVTYSASPFLQPINMDGSSIFKQGSTVPVKFQLTGASAGIQDLVANLRIARVNNNIVGDEVEAVTSTPASTGSLFRYDATSGQYIYNWGTKSSSAGTYQLRLDLGDGNGTRTVLISLKK